MNAPKSLRSFYGSKDREQEIFTPTIILDAIAKVWPEGIALDPCPHTESPVFDRAHNFHLDGLNSPWQNFTYANPPFKYLKDWLAKAMEEYVSGVREIMILAPVRTRRVWFRGACVLADDIAWLNPVTFVGYPGTFPADLCVLYYGDRFPLFRDAFNPLGDCAGWQ